ncbi:unnamed protein product [Amoebophrya sp. A25]|nr:unnamed protein product [Amoebophrya sp. A25]|eukprot:GSA25T00014508001.1
MVACKYSHDCTEPNVDAVYYKYPSVLSLSLVQRMLVKSSCYDFVLPLPFISKAREFRKPSQEGSWLSMVVPESRKPLHRARPPMSLRELSPAPAAYRRASSGTLPGVVLQSVSLVGAFEYTRK